MSRIFRRVACGGLLALALSLPPSPASANGFGLFGARQTAYLDTVETYYSLPVATSYVVPTTAVVSSSYLLPTSSVVYRPARYTLSPTIYRPVTTSLVGSVLPTRYSVLPTRYSVLPTRYLVGGSVLSPTRYYLDDVLSTAYYPSTYSYPSSYSYDVPVIGSAPTIYVDRPVVSSTPAVTSTPRSQPQQEPPLERNRQQGNPPGTGRAPSLESQPIDPRPQEPAPEPEQPGGQEIVPESPTPPDLPSPEDGSIEGIMPLPEPFEMRQSQRPAFGGILPGSTLVGATKLVQGRVRDERSGQPVGGAVVTFSNTVSSFAERRAVTDPSGQFQLAEFLPDGDWSIVVSGGGDAPTRTYPQITVMGGRIYDRLGRDYSKLVLDY